MSGRELVINYIYTVCRIKGKTIYELDSETRKEEIWESTSQAAVALSLTSRNIGILLLTKWLIFRM